MKPLNRYVGEDVRLPWGRPFDTYELDNELYIAFEEPYDVIEDDGRTYFVADAVKIDDLIRENGDKHVTTAYRLRWDADADWGEPSEAIPYGEMEICYAPFDDLAVRLGATSAVLRTPDGDPYEDSMLLTGRDAYDFLVCLNREDKRQAKIQQERGGGAEETRFSLSFGRYATCELSVSLGNLELGNKGSVAEALDTWLPSCWHDIQYNLLENPEAMEEDFRSRKQAGEFPMDASFKTYRGELQRTLDGITGIMERFRKEEPLFLKAHPEYCAINGEKAVPYSYACREQDDIPLFLSEKGILDVRPADNLRGSLQHRPEQPFPGWTGETVPCMLVIPEEDLRKMEPLLHHSLEEVKRLAEAYDTLCRYQKDLLPRHDRTTSSEEKSKEDGKPLRKARRTDTGR